MGLFANVLGQMSYSSKKTFTKSYKTAVIGFKSIEKSYRRDFGRNPFKNHEHFSSWYIQKYGAVDLDKL